MALDNPATWYVIKTGSPNQLFVGRGIVRAILQDANPDSLSSAQSNAEFLKLSSRTAWLYARLPSLSSVIVNPVSPPLLKISFSQSEVVAELSVNLHRFRASDCVSAPHRRRGSFRQRAVLGSGVFAEHLKLEPGCGYDGGRFWERSGCSS